MLDAKRPRAFDEPVHRRAVEAARTAETIRAREAREPLEVHFLREPPERTVGHVARLAKRAGLEVVRDQANDLCTDVEAVDGVDVQPIEQQERRRDARLLVIERANPSVAEGGRW